MSGSVPGLEVAHLPLALGNATGFALHPRLVAVAHVTREEIAAGHAILVVGRRDRRDRTTRAGAGVLPRHAAAIGAAAAEKFAHGRARDGEILLRRHGGERAHRPQRTRVLRLAFSGQ